MAVDDADFHSRFDIADPRRELGRRRINPAGAGNSVDCRHSSYWHHRRCGTLAFANCLPAGGSLDGSRPGSICFCVLTVTVGITGVVESDSKKYYPPKAPVAANKSNTGKMPKRRAFFGSASAPVAVCSGCSSRVELSRAVGAPINRARADKSCWSSRCISASDACLESNSL